MQLAYLYAIISVLIVSLLSLIGVAYLSLKDKKFKKLLIYSVSFSAGALFGDVFFHLLPEAVEDSGLTIALSSSLLSGIIVLFIIEKFIHWRHCHFQSKSHIHPFAFTNLIGDALHNLIDGLIIGASYLASIPVGIATTVAVILHEIPQEIGDFGILMHGGFSKSRALLFNFISALTAVVGALIALFLSSRVGNINNFLIPFAAGGFIYIAGSDLIPELHKEVKLRSSFIQLLMLLSGLAVMFLLALVE